MGVGSRLGSSGHRALSSLQPHPPDNSAAPGDGLIGGGHAPQDLRPQIVSAPTPNCFQGEGLGRVARKVLLG